jgi:geranylgeranyl diphosphate synthase, type I
MTSPPLASEETFSEPGSGRFTDRVGDMLRTFMDHHTSVLVNVSPSLRPVADELRRFVMDGGKRLRPAFCEAGWRGAGGTPFDERVMVAAASLELLHGCALIHDDIMDASDTRRGSASVHRRFELLHRDDGLRGPADRFGSSMAILLGDFCLTWCNEMFDACGLPPDTIRTAKRFFHLMHTEVIAGQCLDLMEQANGFSSAERAHTVMHYKTAKYTIERPLHIGAVLAGADEELIRRYSDFALPLGEAFQLRDDLLGVFGDPARTGKPVGDDLREGKPNVLVTLARERATTAQAAEMDSLFGNPGLDAAGVRRLTDLVARTGAVPAVEALITARTEAALTVLDRAPLAAGAARLLTGLAVSATRRER